MCPFIRKHDNTEDPLYPRKQKILGHFPLAPKFWFSRGEYNSLLLGKRTTSLGTCIAKFWKKFSAKNYCSIWFSFKIFWNIVAWMVLIMYISWILDFPNKLSKKNSIKFSAFKRIFGWMENATCIIQHTSGHESNKCYLQSICGKNDMLPNLTEDV